MAITKEDVLEFISGLSVLELSALVKDFEEKFGVSAAPVMVAGGAVAARAGRAEAGGCSRDGHERRRALLWQPPRLAAGDLLRADQWRLHQHGGLAAGVLPGGRWQRARWR